MKLTSAVVSAAPLSFDYLVPLKTNNLTLPLFRCVCVYVCDVTIAVGKVSAFYDYPDSSSDVCFWLNAFVRGDL